MVNLMLKLIVIFFKKRSYRIEDMKMLTKCAIVEAIVDYAQKLLTFELLVFIRYTKVGKLTSQLTGGN